MSQNPPKFPSIMNNKAKIFTLEFVLFLIFISTSLHLRLIHAGEDPITSPEPHPRYKSNNALPDSSLMVMLIILFFGFCVIFTISICILQCSNDSSPHEARRAFAFNGGVLTEKAQQRGLHQSKIDSLPKFLYSEVNRLKIGTISPECAVCLTEFEEVETLRLLPKCNHVFHVECIDFWLVDHHTCPVCRANIVIDPAESTQECQLEVGESSPSCDQHHVQLTVDVPEKKIRLPRSNSTGHLMGRPGFDDVERFTLRLPVEVRLRLLMAAQPRKTTNLVALRGVSSPLRGYRSEGSGSIRSDRFSGRAGRQYNWLISV